MNQYSPKLIVLISCVSKKGVSKTKAKNLYISTLFKYSLAYANSLRPYKIYILSALHHLLDLETEIEPYNVTLCNVPKNKRKVGLKVLNPKEKKEWGEKVIEQLSKQADLKNDHFIILAGQEYIQPIAEYLTHVELPLKGLGQGKRVKFLKDNSKHE
jgi:hypothetical protein